MDKQSVGQDQDASRFFLEAENEEDDYGFLSPVRANSLVEPLVDARNTFKSMEEAVAGAKDYVYFTFWYFQPSTPLQSQKVKKYKLPPLPTDKSGRQRPLITWLDLLEYVIRVNKAEVRIILTDFDPVFSHHHADAWSAYRALSGLYQKLPKEYHSLCQVICSLHGSTTDLVKDKIERQLESHLKILNARGTDIASKLVLKPGLWPFFTRKGKKEIQLRDDADLVAYPASHHQKSCVLDDLVAFCGGLDVTKARLDNEEHSKDSGMPWHDIHCKIQGAIVRDLKRNFIGRWNTELKRFQEFIETANAMRLGEVPALPAPVATPLTDKGFQGRSFSAGATAQVLRTITQESALFTTPSVLRNDIEQVYKKAIGNATSFIYIENQYLRAVEVSEWLVRRSEEVPELQLIIVLPVAPEEARMKKVDEATQHGLALQQESLKLLQQKYKGPLGIYSMVQRKPSAVRHLTDHCGSRMIYVHSKLLIADDTFCMIGSPNATLRSFRVDTELAIGWFDPAAVAAFRVALWNELLGAPKNIAEWKPQDFIKEWSAIAQSNAVALDGKTRSKNTSPRHRRGFIVPHDVYKFSNKANKIDFFPDEFAELGFESEMFSEAIV